MKKIALLMALVMALAISTGMAAEKKEKKNRVTVEKLDGKVRVEIDGKLFTEYYHGKDVPRPYFYPVIGPTGEAVNRHWPLKDGVEGEEKDHPHHRSLWFTHGDVNGQDFWSESGKHGFIKQVKFEEVAATSPVSAVIKTTNEWVARDGKVVCTDTRTHTIRITRNGPMIDFDISIHASNGKVVFGDTKEGSMAIRLAPTLRVKGNVAKGHILNSEGVKDGDTWGKRAAWVDYYGPLAGETVGVAIFDHPSNPRSPTWWHVRDYGLFAANPFGVHYFEKKEVGAGDLEIPEGKDLNLKYRFFIHKGDTEQGKVAAQFARYAK